MTVKTSIDGIPADQIAIIDLLRNIDKKLGKILELLEAQWGPIM